MNQLTPNSTAATLTADTPWLSRTVQVAKITSEIEEVATLHLTLTDPVAAATYRFLPGQFNMLYLPGAGESAISLSGDSASRETLDHTVRIAGNVTDGLAALQPGDTLGLRGPFGSSWPLAECIGHDVILVAGGIGLPPLRPVIYKLLENRRLYGRLHLLYGARTPDSRMFTDEYKSWESRGWNVQTTVDRSQPGYKGNVGVVPILLERLRAFDTHTAQVLVCGPEVMMRFVARMAFERGLSPTQLWVSTERNMQCATGLCGHCQLGPAFICKHGPVFRYDQIAPYLRVEGL